MKPFRRKRNDQKSIQPSQAQWVTLYEACDSAVDLIVASPEGLNLGRCRPNFLSTPAKVAAARW